MKIKINDIAKSFLRMNNGFYLVGGIRVAQTIVISFGYGKVNIQQSRAEKIGK